MKKLIYQILIIALVLGTIGTVPSLASYSQQEAIEFIKSNGCWKESGSFMPEQAATRAETASVMANFLSDIDFTYSDEYKDVASSDTYASDIALATNLGLVGGWGGNFRPNDAITRQEFAVMLLRAYDAAGVEIRDTNYFTELIVDYDSIGDWAKSAVTDLLGNGFMLSESKKRFNPAGTVTRGELAEAVYNLYYATEPDKVSYTVRDIDASDDIVNDFTVIDSGLYMKHGMAGVGVVARFDNAPGEIYVRRNKGTFNNHNGNLAPAVCFVRVVGPDGNVICRVDMDYKDKGLMEKIINIPEGGDGIYQIQFIGGIHNDAVSIGIKDYKSYGIRAEDYIRFTDSIPKNGYIYVPQKVRYLSMGIGGSGNPMLKLYSADGLNHLGTAKRSANDLTYSDGVGNPVVLTLDAGTIAADSIYKYAITGKDSDAIAAGFNGVMQIRGITPVIYPTEEYARDLMSGYIMHSDDYITNLQLAGPLQVKARERMVEIYEEMKEAGNEKFTVDVTGKLPKESDLNTLDNATAEAQLFANYSHSIYRLKGLLAIQCVDPKTPWFGSYITLTKPWTGELTESDYKTTTDWQQGYYDIDDTRHAFTGALSINSELNAYYNDPVLQKRAELMFLFLATQAPADGLYIYNCGRQEAFDDGSFRVNENFCWGEQGTSESYLYVRNHFSPKTRAITDESMHLNADKLMNFTGRGPTNQLLMSINGTLSMYKWSGEERYHENAKRLLMALSAPCEKDWYHGQSKLGYFIESGGADGGEYGLMNEQLWSSMVWSYLTLPESRQDPELKASIVETAEHYMKWDSYFHMTRTESFGFLSPTNWTSRKDSALGGHSARVGDDYIHKLFPRAKKNWLISVLDYEYNNYKTFTPTTRIDPATETVASQITNDSWAEIHLRKYLPDSEKNYDSMFEQSNPNKYTPTNSEMYYVHHGDQQFDDSQMPLLPFEASGDNNIFLDENGIVAIKHKGIYLLSYFNNSLSGDSMSNISWMGGGPTTIWDDYFATTLHPRKINGLGDILFVDGVQVNRNTDYNRFGFGLDKVRHSCILGTDKNGKLIVSGREPSQFSWIEEDKSFRLSGKDYTSQKTFTWDYSLTNDGISIKAGVDAVATGEDLYVQLPIVKQKNAAYIFDEENKCITLEYDGNKISYKWTADNSRVSPGNSSTPSITDTSYIYLRIKLTASEPYAKITVTRTLY